MDRVPHSPIYFITWLDSQKYSRSFPGRNHLTHDTTTHTQSTWHLGRWERIEIVKINERLPPWNDTRTAQCLTFCDGDMETLRIVQQEQANVPNYLRILGRRRGPGRVRKKRILSHRRGCGSESLVSFNSCWTHHVDNCAMLSPLIQTFCSAVSHCASNVLS